MRSSRTKGNASRKSTSKSLSGCTRRSRRRKEENSDDGADAFDDSEVEEGDSEEYDTDDFSEEFTDEEDD